MVFVAMRAFVRMQILIMPTFHNSSSMASLPERIMPLFSLTAFTPLVPLRCHGYHPFNQRMETDSAALRRSYAGCHLKSSGIPSFTKVGGDAQHAT